MQWRTTLSKGGDLLLTLIETLVFGFDLDSTLMNALSSRRAPAYY